MMWRGWWWCWQSGAPSPPNTTAVLAHATALRRLVCVGYSDELTQAQLRALLGALAALPALEYLRMPGMEDVVLEAHAALGSPLGARLQFSSYVRASKPPP